LPPALADALPGTRYHQRMKTFLTQRVLFPLARIYWKVVRPKTFGVKGVVVRPGDERVLLVRHAYGDTAIWSLPGGGYRPRNEAAHVAVAREIHEELGLAVREPVLLGEYKTQAQGKRDTVAIFSCPVGDEVDEAAFTLNDELAEARWFTPAEVEALDRTYPITTRSLELYREHDPSR